MIDAVLIVLLIAIFYSSVRSLVKDRAKGSSGCGCGCSSCAMSGHCKSSAKQS
ncbi:MAG: FeoB-associated Cys-rich membrane protein [Clostridium sp.]|nr:FeoB-associated Cys-rich membrane protein [Clostridium sp.]MCM1399712.1 FeoB-associated Cys-rich membrane protein [Clostridium sp.]MCM1460453.1 FeoB-associated Cys-rich membrane protein [Bacteroides sp.]